MFWHLFQAVVYNLALVLSLGLIFIALTPRTENALILLSNGVVLFVVSSHGMAELKRQERDGQSAFADSRAARESGDESSHSKGRCAADAGRSARLCSDRTHAGTTPSGLVPVVMQIERLIAAAIAPTRPHLACRGGESDCTAIAAQSASLPGQAG